MSPPRPSIVPSPTMPTSVPDVTLISGLHCPLPVLFPAHLPEPAVVSDSAGFFDRNSVVPVSSHRLTPDFMFRPAATNAVLSPSTARRTAWPTGQAVIAAWIAAESSVSSLGSPLGVGVGDG